MAGHKTEDNKTNDRHGWNRSDSKNIIRIDHSDVYIENERLGEDLEFTMANIHRSKYRQFLNRDSEIIQLKKSLAKMRQANVGSSILKRTTIGKRDPRPRVPSETRITNPVAANGSPDKKVRRKKTSFQSQYANSVASPTLAPKVKNISINMPDVDKNATYSDVSTDDSEDDDDDDITFHSEESDHDSPRCKTLPRPNTGQVKSPKKENKSPRAKSSTFDDPYAPNKRALSLKALKKMLRLENIPAAWYTTVVPASDVSLNKRAGRSALYELTNPRNNPHIHSWEPWRNQSSRPGSKATNSPGEKRSHYYNDNLRPHTSLGMSRMPDSRQTNESPSQGDSPRTGSSRQASRPMTAASHQNQRASSLSSKTVRQLKEISEQDEQATIFNRPRTGVALMLDETREKRKIIDQKINLFLRSLDELQKAKRWKEQGLNIQPMQSSPDFSNLASFSSATVSKSLPSRDIDETDGWRSVHSGSRNARKLDDALKTLASRPTSVS